MSESCLPMPGTTIGDAGPYPVGGATVLGWWDKAYLADRAGGRISQTALADIGVYYSVDDQLECTVAADTISVDVDTGASLVDGTLHYNNADPVNVPIPAAGAGDDRIDLVVVRKNYDATTTYTPGGAAPTVGPRETRITVIRGVEAVGPAAPTVTQDTTRATYWDIPLCSVQVDDAGALTLLTDLREYVDAETKVLWVQSPIGRNLTDGTDIALDPTQFTSSVMGIPLPNNKSAAALGAFITPLDFIDSMTLEAVVYTSGIAGNAYGSIAAFYGSCGQIIGTHSEIPAAAVAAIGDGFRDCIASVALSDAAAGDMVNCRYRRDATDILDTLGGSLWCLGFRAEYLGWK